MAATAASGPAVDALTDREARALRERLVVLETDADGICTVFSEDGTEYTVDVEDGACTCPDAEYHNPAEGCKHEAAAAFLTGAREIPAWVDRESINAQLAGYGEGR